LLLTIICTPFSSLLCEVAFDNYFIKEFYDDDDDHPMQDRKVKVRSIVFKHMSTNPENLVKIGLVHSEIIALQGDIKIKK